jgi:hypothetical protein
MQLEDLTETEPKRRGRPRKTPETLSNQPINNSSLPSREEVAALIWPTILERVARRLRKNDERFKTAAKDANEAAKCFVAEAEGKDPQLVALALAIWPSIWRDYVARGIMRNLELALESVPRAFEAARVFTDGGEQEK